MDSGADLNQLIGQKGDVGIVALENEKLVADKRLEQRFGFRSLIPDGDANRHHQHPFATLVGRLPFAVFKYQRRVRVKGNIVPQTRFDFRINRSEVRAVGGLGKNRQPVSGVFVPVKSKLNLLEYVRPAVVSHLCSEAKAGIGKGAFQIPEWHRNRVEL